MNPLSENCTVDQSFPIRFTCLAEDAKRGDDRASRSIIQSIIDHFYHSLLSSVPSTCIIPGFISLYLFQSSVHGYCTTNAMNPTRRGSESEGSNPTSSASPTPTLRDNRPLPPIIDTSPSLPEQSSDKTPQSSGIGKGHPVVSPNTP